MKLSKRFLFVVQIASVALLSLGLFSRTNATVPTDFTDTVLRDQLIFPCDFAFLPDGRLFVIEQFSKTVRLVLPTGAFGNFEPAMMVDSVSDPGLTEKGLLSIAVDSRWPSQPYVYIYYDATDGFIHVSRYQGIGDLNNASSGNLRLDASSRYDVLRDIRDNSQFDNGGCLRFGPDSLLYVSIGDDEGNCPAQDSLSLLGKILRLEVRNLPAGPGGPANKTTLVAAGNPLASKSDPNERLLWAIGLRNPFRFSIDRFEKSLFIGDVGSSLQEEIDYAASGGLNFGWPIREGTVPTALTSCPGIVTPPFTSPIYSYTRPSGQNVAVIGGPIYHPNVVPLAEGPSMACDFPPDYEYDYFFGDYYQGFLRRLEFSNGTWQIAPAVPGQGDASNWGTGIPQVSSWQEGPDGAIWYCRQAINNGVGTGSIHRICYTGPIGAVLPSESRVHFAPPIPTPARDGAAFEFTLARDSRVSLGLYDPHGRLVRALIPEAPRSRGSHRIEWDGRAADGSLAPPGLYFARLMVDGVAYSRRVIVLH